jgi:hypothetical protein
LYETVTEPLWLTVNEPACKANEADLDPAAIATDDGAVSKLLTVDTTTFAPPAGAFVKVTVQVLEVEGLNVAAPQTSEETRVDAARLIVALAELPL